MWALEPSEEYLRREKRFRKKKPLQLAAVVDNLDTVLKAFREGLTLEQVATFGFIHREPQGVLAIDQKGAAVRLAQTRLYIYVCMETKIIHLITLGDKASQHNDIKSCAGFMNDIPRGKGKTHEPQKALP